MTRHVSTENLARFRGGDLGTARSARIAAHLRGCALCRETSEALARVPSLLAAVEVPPMPAHLAARIESALATESARREASEPDGAPAHRAARSAGGGRHRPQRPILARPALRVLATTGAAVVLVGGFVTLLTELGSGSSSSGLDAGGARHKVAESGPLAAPSFSFGTIHYHAGGHTAVITPQRSGTHYQSGRLTQQVSRVIASSERLRAGGTALPNSTYNGSASSEATAQDVRPGCVSRVAAGHKVQLVDIARFDGRPATIIVTAAKGQAAAQIWVVGTACSASASDVLAHRPLARR